MSGPVTREEGITNPFTALFSDMNLRPFRYSLETNMMQHWRPT